MNRINKVDKIDKLDKILLNVSKNVLLRCCIKKIEFLFTNYFLIMQLLMQLILKKIKNE